MMIFVVTHAGLNESYPSCPWVRNTRLLQRLIPSPPACVWHFGNVEARVLTGMRALSALLRGPSRDKEDRNSSEQQQHLYMLYSYQQQPIGAATPFFQTQHPSE